MSTQNKTVPVIKSVNTELKQGIYLVLAPDEVDLHGDTYSEEEVRKACHNFNLFCRQANLAHEVATDAFSIVESYCSPVEMVVGETFIKKGSWLAVLQYNNDDLWALAKEGEFNGVSIGAMAFVEDISNAT